MVMMRMMNTTSKLHGNYNNHYDPYFPRHLRRLVESKRSHSSSSHHHHPGRSNRPRQQNLQKPKPKPKPMMMNQQPKIKHKIISSPPSSFDVNSLHQQDETTTTTTTAAAARMEWPTIASILLLPLIMVGYVLSESITGNNQISKNEALRRQFLKQYGGISGEKGQNNTASDVDLDAIKDCNNSLSLLSQKRPLCYCVVRKSYGFTHCMGPSLQVGDVVEVLEEFVGPVPDDDHDGQSSNKRQQQQQQQQQNHYALCRFVPKEEETEESKRGEYVYGWFPIRWLQKLEDYQASVTKIQRQQQILQQQQQQ